ncbi:hypothetical protein [Asticcacaulis sp.]|uniref:hypothetical protein n=1 Tax=Asticcacaulis sp. TaxID=1872648 RepID=UPI002BB8055C|nr:hypothetical protein [Asticcacaulis sp.]HTM82085.1 hypothetical protein [Asticcacaulis sp.]
MSEKIQDAADKVKAATGSVIERASEVAGALDRPDVAAVDMEARHTGSPSASWI